MKWILLVFGSHPVETDLLFDSLDTCLKAEETMRKAGTARALGVQP